MRCRAESRECDATIQSTTCLARRVSVCLLAVPRSPPLISLCLCVYVCVDPPARRRRLRPHPTLARLACLASFELDSESRDVQARAEQRPNAETGYR